MSGKNTDANVGSSFLPANSDSSHCRAKRAGFGDYVICLENPPHDCGYAMHMGDDYLCLHPHHLEFAIQTEADLRG